jgi:hypothetical protein
VYAESSFSPVIPKQNGARCYTARLGVGKASNSGRCLTGATLLTKSGITAAGTQCWRCLHCGASSVRTRPDVTRRGELQEFLTWLMGKNSQSEATNTLTGRSMRQNTAWCWDVEPTLAPSNKIHHEVLIDRIWVGTWCLRHLPSRSPKPRTA